MSIIIFQTKRYFLEEGWQPYRNTEIFRLAKYSDVSWQDDTAAATKCILRDRVAVSSQL